MASAARAFQIYYDGASRAALDPDFEPLDNSANERPDWYEYWPISGYLRSHPLDESTLYAFLSPRFFEKTGLTGRRAREFVREAGEVDVVTFSPLPCYAAWFTSVFDQLDYFHRGLFDVSARFFREVDPGVDLEALVTHTGNTVFSNYFFASARFWREWRRILDRLLELAESPGSPLYGPLNQPAEYTKDDGHTKPAQVKVFVMERAASFLLAGRGGFTVRNFPPFEMPMSGLFQGLRDALVELDGLKKAFAETRDPRIARRFNALRDSTAASAWPAGRPAFRSLGD
jgi:hypothetical protein